MFIFITRKLFPLKSAKQVRGLAKRKVIAAEYCEVANVVLI